MPALVTFITGRAGSGKSREIFAAMADAAVRGERAYLIVPEQFTFAAEKSLVAENGGLFGAEVTSFDRLAERILKLTGRQTPFLSADGLAMIVRRVLIKNAEKLNAFSRVAEKPGFSAELASWVAKLTGAGVSPKALSDAAQKLPKDALLAGKLTDLALVYGETQAYLKSRFLSPDDALNAAAERLPGSFIAGARVFIDDFEGATHAVYPLTKGLFLYAKSVTVTLCCCELGARDREVFALDAEQLGILEEMAASLGCTVKRRELSALPLGRSAECAHLERNLFAESADCFRGAAKNALAFTAPNRRREAEAVADRTITFLHERRARYRDVAVLCPDLASYAGPLTRAFESRGIPAFVDRREKLKNHHLTRFLLASVRAAAGDYYVPDVLTVAKAGFIALEEGGAEALENAILRRGVKGTKLLRPFEGDLEDSPAEKARAAVLGALSALSKALKQRSVSEKVRAVYAYLTDQNVTVSLTKTAAMRQAEGRLKLMQFDLLSYNRIIDTLSQLDAILGSMQVSRADFASMLEEGLTDAEVGLVPQLRDGVLIGEIGRTRTPPVRALFIVGAADGLLPRPVADDGLIDDAELALLSEQGVSGLTGTKALARKDLRALYLTFAKAKERVTLSYALSADGTEQLPSPLLMKLLSIFPERVKEQPTVPQSGAAALTRLARALSDWQAGFRPDPLLPSLLSALPRGPLAETTEKIVRAADNDPILPNLPNAAVDALYGRRVRMSASRLERFAACPFAHFAAYGLITKERPVRRERSADLGLLYHAALDAFIKTCLAEQRDFAAMTEADADLVADAVLPKVLSEHNGGYFIEDARARAQLPLIVESIKLGCRAVTAQLAAGSFTPVGSELRFGKDCTFPPIVLTLSGGRSMELSGVIDRMDRAKDEDGELLRVVDYKTGGRPFAFAPILHGLTLQLPLYLEAVAAAGGMAAGLYYMQLAVPAPDAEKDAEAAMTSAFALRGLTLSSARAVFSTEKELSGASSVVKGLRVAKDGTVKGTVCTGAQMRALLSAAKRIAKDNAERMLLGDIEAFPTGSSCEYCLYAGCCRFDPTLPKCKMKQIDRVPAEAFFREIGGYGDALDE